MLIPKWTIPHYVEGKFFLHPCLIVVFWIGIKCRRYILGLKGVEVLTHLYKFRDWGDCGLDSGLYAFFPKLKCHKRSNNRDRGFSQPLLTGSSTPVLEHRVQWEVSCPTDTPYLAKWNAVSSESMIGPVWQIIDDRVLHHFCALYKVLIFGNSFW